MPIGVVADGAPGPSSGGSSGSSSGSGGGYSTAPVTAGWVFPVDGYEEWNRGSFMPGRPGDPHPGIDVYAAEGAVIRMPIGGKVLSVGNASDGSDGGNRVTILGSDGITYYFAHMQFPPDLKSGQSISAGGVLGAVGRTGNVTGKAHLHFTMKKNGTVIDPRPHMEQSTGGAAMTQNGGSNVTGGPVSMPTGGEVYDVAGEKFMMYTIKGLNGVSTKIFFKLDPNAQYQGTPQSVTAAQWASIHTGAQNGGASEAFRGSEPGRSFDDYMTQVLMEMGIYGTDALADKGVLDVIAMWMARPDMSETEFQSRLAQTEWYSTRTDKQRAWNDKSTAQQELEISDAAGQLVGVWFTYTGEDLDLSEFDLDGDGRVSASELKKGNPELYNRAMSIASGTATQTMVVNEWIKPYAKQNPESPWSRTLRNEEQQQGEHGRKVADEAGKVMELYRQYGFEISVDEAKKIGEDLVMNRTSFTDVELGLDEQAMVLYPSKPKGVTVMSWAQPYRQTYQSVLELGEPALTDATLSNALSQGMSLGEFRKQLKHDDRWQDTKNAKDEVFGVLSGLGNQMGF